LDSLLTRGNKLTLLRGERRELRFEKALPARGIAKMEKKGKKEGLRRRIVGGRGRVLRKGSQWRGSSPSPRQLGSFAEGQ
jgi:hypothetical protein